MVSRGNKKTNVKIDLNKVSSIKPRGSDICKIFPCLIGMSRYNTNVRSKMQWVEEGERSSKYFLNLETKNFVNKTIPRLVNNEGCLINKQEHILLKAKNFCQNLYSKKDIINSVDLNKEIQFLDVPKLTNEIRDTLEGKISYSELTAAIKRMKVTKAQDLMDTPVSFLNSFG